MNKKAYIPADTTSPDMETPDCRAFEINFQRAILLSLLESRKLTQAQFGASMERIVKKYAAPFSSCSTPSTDSGGENKTGSAL